MPPFPPAPPTPGSARRVRRAAGPRRRRTATRRYRRCRRRRRRCRRRHPRRRYPTVRLTRRYRRTGPPRRARRCRRCRIAIRRRRRYRPASSHWRHCRSTGATTASAQTRLPHPWLTVAATRWPPRQMRTPRHRPSGLAQTGYETLLPERPPLGSPGRVGRTERRPPSIPRRGRGDHRRRRSGRRRVFVGQRGADALEIRGHRRHGLRRNQHKRHPVPRTSPSRTRPRPCIIGAIARNGSYRDPGSSFGGSTRLFGSTIRPDPGEHGGAP